MVRPYVAKEIDLAKTSISGAVRKRRSKGIPDSSLEKI